MRHSRFQPGSQAQIIGFFVAIISAVNFPEIKFGNFTLSNSLLVIVLTGVSTTCVSILGQLRIADLARAREVGRINCASLVAHARITLFSNRDTADLTNESLP
jgi:hypothetical protein